MKFRAFKKIPHLPHIAPSRAIFFLVWPFGAMIGALKSFRTPQAKTIFWLFCIYFGFVFVFEDPNLGKFGADSASYAARLIALYDNPASLQALFNSFYHAEEQVVDVYQPLATWLVSLLTGDPRVLFALFAAVFGYFYTQNLWMIFNSITKRVGLFLLLLMLAYAMVNPIWNINGVRMWTAAHVFLYGSLRYFLYTDRKGLIWSAASILFHFSFMFPVAVFFMWLFLPKKDYLFLTFYFITAFFLEIKLQQVRGLLSFLPDVFQPRISGYTNQDYADLFAQANSATRWYVQLAQKGTTWIIYIWIAAAYIKRKMWKLYSPVLYRLFMFALFMGGFANLAAQVAAGGRFVVIANGFFYAFFVVLLGNKYIRLNLESLKLVSIPFLLFSFIFNARVGLGYTGILAFIGNPLIAPFLKEQTPLIDFIKQLF